MTSTRHIWPVGIAWVLVAVLGVGTSLLVQRLWVVRGEVEELAGQLSLESGKESTLLLDANDAVVSALFEEYRMPVRLAQVSPHLIHAVLVTEDRRFYEHRGVDVRRIVKAALVNYRAGTIVQGGSTVTQQLVRGMLLDREKSYARKLKEAALALRLEERFSKDAILESYLNRVYFGDGFYGVEAAARGYFGKPASALNVGESALLAGVIKGPSVYSPSKSPDLAKQRRDVVLSLLYHRGLLASDEYERARAQSLPVLVSADDRRVATHGAPGGGYFRDAVTRELLERFGAEAVYTGGLRVHTTLDPRLQALAEETIAARLAKLPSKGQDPLQAALVSLDPVTGHVKAIVGGRDFAESPFNRATDARRQPGSAFKPFIFALALESGYALSTELNHLDEPILTHEGAWLPNGEHETETVRLRDALVVSSNRAAAHLLQDVGVHRTVELVHRLGVASPMPSVPSLALGTGEMTLFELTSAYSVFANRGYLQTPVLIRRVVDRYGRELYRSPEVVRPVISEATAYLMSSMMADVVSRGTASSARAAGFTRAAAGKTGTSQSYADAWFVGYTPELVTGVWFGYDQPRSIMNRGFAGVVAVPAWARFMAGALKDSRTQWFPLPGSLVKAKLCRLSGDLATDRCHLPAVGDGASDEVFGGAGSSPVVREGGVFEELRHVSSFPYPCTLTHDEGVFTDAQVQRAMLSLTTVP